MGTDSITGSFHTSITRYFQRKKYERLRKRRRTMKVVSIRGQAIRRACKGRVRMVPRPRFKRVSPKNILLKLRNAYVNLMMDFSGKLMGVKSIGSSYTMQRISINNNVYEEKVLVEIYRSLVARGQLLPTPNDTIQTAE